MSAEPERLQGHTGQGEKGAQGGDPPAQPDSRRPQKQEKGGQEQPVPGIGAQAEQPAIEGVQGG